ncbi:MAG: hypothetical protein LBD13_01850 [Spirochaetaceae bacterium]|jgi:hypothetical protein|nr:hypothetical protein [Spirochaetaceae bacterium]
MTNNTVKQAAVKTAGPGGPDRSLLRDELVELMGRSDAASFICAAGGPEGRRIQEFLPPDPPGFLDDLEIDSDQDTLRYKGVTLENTQEGMVSLYTAIQKRTQSYVDAFKERSVKSYYSGGYLAGLFTPDRFARFIDALDGDTVLRLLAYEYSAFPAPSPMPRENLEAGGS